VLALIVIVGLWGSFRRQRREPSVESRHPDPAAAHVPKWAAQRHRAASGRVPRSLVGRPASADHSGMPAVRALLLVVVALLFVMTVSLVFIGDTGPLEKLVMVAVAVLLALLVPRIQRLGRAASP
jgi:hypothetical protein